MSKEFAMKLKEELEREEADLKRTLFLAAQDHPEALAKLSADPLMMRAAINQAIARVEGAERLMHGQHYSVLEHYYGKKRFEERGLPELDANRAREWAVEMLSSGQEHPLKKDLAALELAILKGEAPIVAQILSRAPMAPWVMDFTLREYEAENLMTFAAKYAPAPADFEIIDLLLSEGLRVPDRTAYARLEAPALASAMPGFTHKGARRVGECLERAGWAFGFLDYLLLFAKAREERVLAGTAGDSACEEILTQKVEMARWLTERGVSPLTRLTMAEGAEAWEEILSPVQGAWVRRERARLAALGEPMTFGLEEVFGQPGAPLRKAGQWAMLGPWMIEAGLSVSRIMGLAEAAGMSQTAELALPWAQKQQLEEVCAAGPSQNASAVRI